MDSEMPYFLVWSLSSSAWCIILYNTCMMMRTYILRGSCYVCWRRACGRLRHGHSSGSRLFHCLLYWLLVRDGEVGRGRGDGEVGRGRGDGEVGRGSGDG